LYVLDVYGIDSAECIEVRNMYIDPTYPFIDRLFGDLHLKKLKTPND